MQLFTSCVFYFFLHFRREFWHFPVFSHTSPTLCTLPRLVVQASYVSILEKIEYLSAKIRKEEDLLWDLKAQMLQLFDILPPEKNDLMIARYISGMKWEDIFKEKCLTKPTALRWHREILARITLPYNAVDVDLELQKLKKVS